MTRPDYTSDESGESRHSRTPSVAQYRSIPTNGRSRQRRSSSSPPPLPPPTSRSRRHRQSADPADREKELADQLRRRALASKEAATSRGLKRRASPSPPRSASQSRSRTPPSMRSSSSPQPLQISKRSTSLSRPQSASPPRDHGSGGSRRRRRDEREQDRRRRRSGRDEAGDEYEGGRHTIDDDDHYTRTLSRSRDGGSRGVGGREDRQSSITRAHDIEEDVRSQRSGHSRHTASREPESYDRHDRDIHRRHRQTSRYDPRVRDDRYERSYRYDPNYYSASYARGGGDRFDHDRRRPRRRSPSAPIRQDPTPDPEEYEMRSVFCSQLAARLTQRDLGEFFEEKLGENTVRDVRIVTDRLTGRSKGIAYVELVSEELVPKAIDCSGEVIFGIPILVQVTDAARNRGEGASTAQAPIRPNLPENGIPKIDPNSLSKLPLPPHLAALAGHAIHLGGVAGGTGRESKITNTAARLYVGSLHFNLVDTDVRAVFEPFGEIESVDLHREPDGKSKGFAFVQYKKAEDAEKAIEHMNGFELAGRNIRVGHVNSRGQDGGSSSARALSNAHADPNGGGGTATVTSSFDEGGGGGLNAYSRANLMQMLARNNHNSESDGSANVKGQAAEQVRPVSIPQATSKAVLLKNMFNPEEETEAGWDLDLSSDVKDECDSKYGKVQICHVDKESSAGEIYLSFEDIDGAKKAIMGLNGRWFGGKQVAADYISESFLKARLN